MFDESCVNVTLPEDQGGGGGATPLESLIRLVSIMSNTYSQTLSGLATRLEVGTPTQIDAASFQAALPLTLTDNTGLIASGTADVLADAGAGSADMMIELTEGNMTRTLQLSITRLYGGVTIRIAGTLAVADLVTGNVTTLNGGWTYSFRDGAISDPNADPGFDQAVVMMFHADTSQRVGTAGIPIPGLDTIFTFIGNALALALNYILDLFIPYTPPEPGECVGPINEDPSCDDVNIPCADKWSDACLLIDDIPNVTDAFKQCMKGRCGCGGSSFSRVRVICEDQDTCGPCTVPALGCSLAGTDIWYCNDSLNACRCVNTLFHEMSHGCGAMDIPAGTQCPSVEVLPKSCSVGNWFEEEFNNQFPQECFLFP